MKRLIHIIFLIIFLCSGIAIGQAATPAYAVNSDCAIKYVQEIDRPNGVYRIYVDVSSMSSGTELHFNNGLQGIHTGETKVVGEDSATYGDGRTYLTFQFQRNPIPDSVIYVFTGKNDTAELAGPDDFCVESGTTKPDGIFHAEEYTVDAMFARMEGAPPSSTSQEPSTQCGVATTTTSDGRLRLWFGTSSVYAKPEYSGVVVGGPSQRRTVSPSSWHPYDGNQPGVSGYDYVYFGYLDDRDLAKIGKAPWTIYATDENGKPCIGSGSDSGQIDTGDYEPDPCATVQDDKAYRNCRDLKVTCADDSNPERCAAEKQCRRDADQGKVFAKVLFFGEGTGCLTFTDFFKTVINYVLMFASLIAAFMFAKGAYGILTSRGNPASVAEARDVLTQATIGLVLIATAFVIIQFLGGAFQIIDSGINLTPLLK